jgi:predicted AAA+ superfamily ATPase
LPHWSSAERHAAFGFSLEQSLCFGGYPGAAPLIEDPQRWRRYVLDSLIETTIARDVLLMTRVDKPVLLRRVFELGCRYSGQVLSYTKMLGQLQDAGKFRGRLVESSVGAHFTNAASDSICELFLLA